VPTGGSIPLGITSGPDGNLWFTENGTGKVAAITTSGSITEYTLTAGRRPFAITSGPQSALWFAEVDSSPGGGNALLGSV
jgi:virginiamycin B lyase